MSKFQIVLLAIFGLFLIGGVLVFSSYRGSSQNASNVVVWGTISSKDFNLMIEKSSLYGNKLYNIKYVEKDEENFDKDFIEALASGDGPDIFMLPSDKIVTHRNKIFPIPYEVFTQRQFKDTFIEGSEIYMAPEGLLGMPIFINPMVMYWNRDIFTEVKLTQVPEYWDELYNLSTAISKKDGALNISRSAVALGEFANISHAKELIINLAMQAGTPVTVWDSQNIRSVFSDMFGKPTMPAEAAINFFTEFSNPAKKTYSWNRSLPSSVNYFLSGDLALYFGFADEIQNLQLKNPNLNFDVAPVPVSREGGVPVSYAEMNAFAITKSSKNISPAFVVVSALVAKDPIQVLSNSTSLPSPRRDLLSQRQSGSYLSVFWDSAIRSRAWLDPSPESSDLLFRDMIQSITSGRVRTSEAVNRIQRELSAMFTK